MSETQKIKVGQVWVEKKARLENDHPRRLMVVGVGDEEFSHQPGNAEITPITYDIQITKTDAQRPGLWKRSKRTMYAFGLRKVWRLEVDA